VLKKTPFAKMEGEINEMAQNESFCVKKKNERMLIFVFCT